MKEKVRVLQLDKSLSGLPSHKTSDVVEYVFECVFCVRLSYWNLHL